MSGIIGIIVAVLAIFLLVKAIGLIFKIIAIVLLVGLAVGAFVVIRRKIGGPR